MPWNLRHFSAVSSKGEILISRGARENQGRVCEGYTSISLLNSGSLDLKSLQNKGWPPAPKRSLQIDALCHMYVISEETKDKIKMACRTIAATKN